MKATSGPITVEIREGMVPVAKFVFEDTRCALLDDWPERVKDVLERIETDFCARTAGRDPEQ